MAPTSEAILERFRRDHAKDIDLTLRPSYRQALEKLGNPHLKLPPVFHVAGTNGKGSTCAFLRAICEAAGLRVHVYTSPHLVRFHERIRIAGKLIEEAELVSILEEIASVTATGDLSYFEAATATAFVAFARTAADITILEVGLGGRLDATNVIDQPLATIISRISFDHRDYLGDTLAEIAREKAGIMRKGVPCFVAAQPDVTVAQTLRKAAASVGASLHFGGEDWRVENVVDGFIFRDDKNIMTLPVPALPGTHQYNNAGLAIAALSAMPQPPDIAVIRQGLTKVDWPARLQRITVGSLVNLLPQGWELWLDGGHNDSAGEVLAVQAALWVKDGMPLHLICGMLTTKVPREFLQPLAPFVSSLCAIAIAGEPQSYTAAALANEVSSCAVASVAFANNLVDAIQAVTAKTKTGRLLICGSLYLAGDVLRQNAA
jgi:dihydrofolate synthase/folylpolyglutamate synthase